MSEETATEEKIEQFATFHAHGRLFGVPIADVREINTMLDITPVRHAPAAVAGLVNIRGQVYLVLDIRLLMGYPRGESGEDSCLLLFKERVGANFGILVDAVGDIIGLNPDHIVDRRRRQEGLPDGVEDRRTGRESLVRGVAQLDDGLVMVLRSDRLLANIEIGVDD